MQDPQVTDTPAPAGSREGLRAGERGDLTGGLIII